MHLSERFLNLVKQQLSTYEADQMLDHLVVYIARSRDGNTPSLEVVGQWPDINKFFQPVENDPQLRIPSINRRWYPLQEGSILLGVLRAERLPSDDVWPEELDKRLQFTAMSLTHCVGLELDRNQLIKELSQQREQLSVMIHQLRNPLTALRTYAKLLLKKLGPESKHRSLVEGLLSEQDQLNKYLQNLDQLSQINLPQSKVAETSLLLPPVLSKDSLKNIKSLIEPLIERASATANLQGREWHSPSEWPSWTNRAQRSIEGFIAEIVANLLENAFRYSSASAAIGLQFSEEGLCVWDGGRPIKIDERDKIFEKGFRGKDNSDKTGSGLGLALGRKLANQLGGELKLIANPNEFDASLPKQGNAFVLKLSSKVLPK